MALYSVLKARTHIPPHCGMLNTRLICHIPLIVPKDCRLRVGNERHAAVIHLAVAAREAVFHPAFAR